jgi:hypothetical protein
MKNIKKEIELFNSCFLKHRNMVLKFGKDSTKEEPIIEIFDKRKILDTEQENYIGSIFGVPVERTDVHRWNFTVYTLVDPGSYMQPPDWDDVENKLTGDEDGTGYGCWFRALEGFLENQFKAEFNDACEAMNSELYNI